MHPKLNFPRPTRTLMALAWMNAGDRDKAQFVALYDKIPQCLEGGKLPENRAWLKDSYTAKDYQDQVEELLKKKTAEERPLPIVWIPRF